GVSMGLCLLRLYRALNETATSVSPHSSGSRPYGLYDRSRLCHALHDGAYPRCRPCVGMRSGCQNITLAITPSDGIPCRHGYAPLIPPGTLGTDSTGNPHPH